MSKALTYAIPILFAITLPASASMHGGGGGHMGGGFQGGGFHGGGFNRGFGNQAVRGNRGFGRGRFFSNGFWYDCTPYYYQLGYCAFDY